MLKLEWPSLRTDIAERREKTSKNDGGLPERFKFWATKINRVAFQGEFEAKKHAHEYP
ncbi:unnamed protein product [Fusarium graminearum]|nr:unnamed protein product [Fusarium graminearum]